VRSLRREMHCLATLAGLSGPNLSRSRTSWAYLSEPNWWTMASVIPDSESPEDRLICRKLSCRRGPLE
jgi:hypothetical protein